VATDPEVQLAPAKSSWRARATTALGTAIEWSATTAWRPVVVGRAAWKRDRDIGGGLLAGAIAFRLFVWLTAFVVLIMAGLGFVHAGNGDPAAALAGSSVTEVAAEQINQTAAEVRDTRWLLLVGGLYALFSTSRTMVRALWTTSALAMGQPVTRPPLVRGVLVYNAGMAVLLATVSGADRVRDASPGPGIVVTVAAVVVFLGATWLAMHWMAGPDVGGREVLPGAALVAVGLQLMHLVATLYLPAKLQRASQTYGTLGTAIVLLLWLYLMGRLVVAGAVLNATLRGTPARPSPAELGSRPGGPG
jgi:uncharacterized BrkB/YihY/UPF0761 family membrane protein